VRSDHADIRYFSSHVFSRAIWPDATYSSRTPPPSGRPLVKVQSARSRTGRVKLLVQQQHCNSHPLLGAREHAKAADVAANADIATAQLP
jgi:hypothetical protein